MDLELNSYSLIILFGIIIVLSFLYNAFSARTNIPTVILLIATGMGLNELNTRLQLTDVDLFPLLKIVGIVGLIMIVLEAALDLELRREKLSVIGRSLAIALIGLILATITTAVILYYMIGGIRPLTALLFATPLSILSSAIIIPSVTNLSAEKREFHIYESTFSDILGIMQFYFLLELVKSTNTQITVLEFGGYFALTLLVALLASYLLIFLFQHISSQVKLFMLIAILMMLYAIGKSFHLSSLIIILVFGLALSNHHIFFFGKLKKWLKADTVEEIREDFHVITIESAFVVRTFFFVIFGASIALASLWNINVLLISLAVLAAIYLTRLILFRLFMGKNIFPQIYIAPRGLITVLLFYDIPDELMVANYDPGILLFIIIATSLIMTFALIADGRKRSLEQAASADEKLVIPPDKVYDGFKSKIMAQHYGQKEVKEDL